MPSIALVVQSLNRAQLCKPIDSSMPWSLFRFMVNESVILSNHFILCQPLLLLPSIFRYKKSKKLSVMQVLYTKSAITFFLHDFLCLSYLNVGLFLQVTPPFLLTCTMTHGLRIPDSVVCIASLPSDFEFG